MPVEVGAVDLHQQEGLADQGDLGPGAGVGTDSWDGETGIPLRVALRFTQDHTSAVQS